MVNNIRDEDSRDDNNQTLLPEHEETRTRPRKKSMTGRMIGLAVLAGAITGVIAIYGTKDTPGNQESAACRDSSVISAKIAPLARGQVAALNVSKAPQPLSPVSFKAQDGSARTLADFRGRTVLLNLWATWCIPCREEMPALNQLQAELGGEDFEVVAVNIDTQKIERVPVFLEENGIDRLHRYADPTNGILQSLKNEGLAQGLPVSVLIDRQGCRLAAMVGPAEWASEDAKALVRAAKAGPG